MAKTRTRTVIRYAKRKARRRKGFTIPIALTLPLIWPAQKAYHIYTETGSIESAIRNYFAYYTGWTGNPARSWEPAYLKYGLAPLAAGFVLHKVAGRVGVNRMLASAGVPFVRI